jgi:hypothetical protein
LSPSRSNTRFASLALAEASAQRAKQEWYMDSTMSPKAVALGSSTGWPSPWARRK